jgi:hypothetical protein
MTCRICVPTHVNSAWTRAPTAPASCNNGAMSARPRSVGTRTCAHGDGFVVVTEQHPIVRGVRMTNYQMVKPLKLPLIEIRRAARADAAGMAHVHVKA